MEVDKGHTEEEVDEDNKYYKITHWKYIIKILLFIIWYINNIKI